VPGTPSPEDEHAVHQSFGEIQIVLVRGTTPPPMKSIVAHLSQLPEPPDLFSGIRHSVSIERCGEAQAQGRLIGSR
jgi:hypothetical protein